MRTAWGGGLPGSLGGEEGDSSPAREVLGGGMETHGALVRPLDGL